MTRSPYMPGSRDKKLQLLSGINEARFPDLVSDILYFCRGYRDLKIVDGPGDGRRDIRGHAPAGDRALIQCKFHRDWSKAVASRETDEIVIALAKFGVRHGVFATTGRVSPQAIREYEHNYPAYELSFLDGDDIVDAVFGHPVIRAVWTQGEQIDLNVLRVIVPVIVRGTSTDRPIPPLDVFDGVRLDAAHLRIRRHVFEEADFAPYRAPSAFSPLMGEASRATVAGFGIELEVCLPLHELPTVAQKMVEEVLDASYRINDCVQVRFGRVRIGTTGGDDSGIPVTAIEIDPNTYVLSGAEVEPIAERDWVVPQWTNDWRFPDRHGSLEAEWVGWFNPELECVLIPHLVEPLDIRYDGSALIVRNMDSLVLRESLFYACSEGDAELLLGSLSDEAQPDWSCRGVSVDRVLGWFHPAWDGGFGFLSDDGEYGFRLPGPSELSEVQRSKLNEFEMLKLRLQESTERCGLRRVDWQDAVALSRLSGKPILSSGETIEHRSASLVHYFERIPSPLRLSDRRHVFVQVWKVPVDLEEFVRWQSSAKLGEMISPDLWVNPKYGHVSRCLMPMFSLRFAVPYRVPVSQALQAQVADVARLFSMLRVRILGEWPESVCVTEAFWRDEIGLMFSSPSD